MSDCEYCGREDLPLEDCGPNDKGYCHCCGITYVEPTKQESQQDTNTEEVTE